MIFPWLFRNLPGPTWVRLALLFVILSAIIFVLFEWVFPMLDGWLSEPVVENSETTLNQSSLVFGEGKSN